MASTAGDLRNREIKLFKADGPQFVQRNDKLQGTKAVEPNNATSPHEDAWLRKLLYGEGKRRRTTKWKRLPPPDADFSSLLEGLLDPPGVC